MNCWEKASPTRTWPGTWSSTTGPWPSTGRGRFAESLAAFAQALEVRPGDAACQRYVTLAQKHLETPPPPDWEAGDGHGWEVAGLLG